MTEEQRLKNSETMKKLWQRRSFRKKITGYKDKTLFPWKFNGKRICYDDPKNPEMMICKDVPKDYLWLDITL